MNTYMVDVQLPYAPSPEFFSLIPSQRAKIAELMTQKKILSYTVSADRLKLWIVMIAKDVADAKEILSQQPMDKFFTYISFRELMFHEMAGLMFPAVSLN